MFKFRVKTPNIVLLDPKIVHTFEHLLATAIRFVFPKMCPSCEVTDLSSLECRTGFYVSLLSSLNLLTLEQVTDAISALIPEPHAIGELPGATIETCGDYLEPNFSDVKMNGVYSWIRNSWRFAIRRSCPELFL